MTAPTFVARYDSSPFMTALTGGVNNVATITCAEGDRLLIVAEVSDSTTTWATPTGGTLTWTAVTSSPVTATERCPVYAYTALVGSGQGGTYAVNMMPSNSSNWGGFTVYRYSGSDGIGAVGTNTAGKTATLTTTLADSAIVIIVSDWGAADGSARTWNTTAGTPTEGTYFRDASWHTIYQARYANAGAVGSKTVGLLTPTSTYFSTYAIEVKGAAAAGFADGAPTGGAAVAAGDSQINASWSAYTDATGYDIEVDGVIVSVNQPGLTLADTGLTPSQTRNYRVRAAKTF